MTLKEIHFLPFDKLPEGYLNPEGIIKIKGCGFLFINAEVLKNINVIDRLNYVCLILIFNRNFSQSGIKLSDLLMSCCLFLTNGLYTNNYKIYL
jgi:hypothetical protein